MVPKWLLQSPEGGNEGGKEPGMKRSQQGGGRRYGERVFCWGNVQVKAQRWKELGRAEVGTEQGCRAGMVHGDHIPL